MTEHLSREDTKKFRAAQRGRNLVIAALILLWVVGMWALTMVKGQQAVAEREQRDQIQSHESK